LQCQITELEHELDSFDEAARCGTDKDAKLASRRWETFVKLARDEARDEKKRMRIVHELQAKLHQYRK
jgi:hypothetical protein